MTNPPLNLRQCRLKVLKNTNLENANQENGTLVKWNFGNIELWKNCAFGTVEIWNNGDQEKGHPEKRKLDIRKNGIWGKWILGKMKIWKN